MLQSPQLCYFPSKTFYEGKLRTGPGQWKEGSVVKVWSDSQGRNYPHVLIDVRGLEKNLTVSTEEGNEQSKSNDAEVDHVVIYWFHYCFVLLSRRLISL